ncbi:hypothetical protein T310_7422 [Rasamsonia emersonii CBS 393.64]|uniref:Uncharacterized protein n=1 Tax=Rasamsonia emersonii (strain ATCC 16479 / CBS 393.64 / IMI 116815) TaxID=1408163 RepID=A0A0F4YLA1_RASE3|nr:hypothetical protein T310_7422 [Rasamsonia emersonii CBS 393.64]KKA18621.1 hypothetical protein T310_7422 [Rasamsonia emersonii CBS 393.64]
MEYGVGILASIRVCPYCILYSSIGCLLTSGDISCFCLLPSVFDSRRFLDVCTYKDYVLPADAMAVIITAGMSESGVLDFAATATITPSFISEYRVDNAMWVPAYLHSQPPE